MRTHATAATVRCPRGPTPRERAPGGGLAARLQRAWPALVALMIAVGCDASGDPGTASRVPTPPSASSLRVFAAASLTDVFHDIAARYEARDPGVRVMLNVAGSSTLSTQIIEGAPADVFASADREQMQRVVDAGLAASTPRLFAYNSLAIAVPIGNPARVERLADFADADRYLGLCAPEVPCGRLAMEVFGAAGIQPVPDTLEPHVRALATKIGSGELDGGIVYATDVRADPALRAISIPEAINVTVPYPVVALSRSEHPASAAEFVSFLRTAPAREALRAHGFAVP